MADLQTAEAPPKLIEVDKNILDQIIDKTQKNKMSEQYAFLPKGLDETTKYAQMIVKTGFCPDSFLFEKGKAVAVDVAVANIVIAIMYGYDLGLRPLQALHCIAVINGRPTIWGDGALAVVLASGLVEDFNEVCGTDALKAGAGECQIKRKGMPTPVVGKFSVDDAKKAQLWTKQGPWTNYPGRMLQMRARAFAMRDLFADVLKGIAIAEEVRDYPADSNPHTAAALEATLKQPMRKSEATAFDKSIEQKTDEATPPPAEGERTTESGTWTGKLDRVETQNGTVNEGKRKGQPYSLHYLHTKDGKKFASFSSTVAKDANDAIQKDIEVAIAFGPGKSCPTVKSIAPAIVGEPGEQG